jgi:hypothetical protein
MKDLVEVFWSDDDEGYVAVVPDLPGCSAVGTAPEAVARDRGLDRRLPRQRRPGPRAHDQGSPRDLMTIRAKCLNARPHSGCSRSDPGCSQTWPRRLPIEVLA